VNSFNKREARRQLRWKLGLSGDGRVPYMDEVRQIKLMNAETPSRFDAPRKRLLL